MKFFSPDISKFEKENNTAELLRCLEHKKRSVRFSAFAALAAKTGLDEKIIRQLKKLADDPSPWVRTLVTLKFPELGVKVRPDDLIDIMDRGSVNDRLELMKIIALRGVTEDEAVLQCVAVGLSERKELLKLAAVKAAAATGSRHLMQYLGELLHEKHHKVRMKAAEALYEIGGDMSADYLIGLLADKNEDVRYLAGSLLSGIDIDYVKKALHDAEFRNLISGFNGREPERRKTAARIGEERIREGLPLLHRGCRDRYKGVRIESLRSMAVFRSQSSIEFAERLLSDRFYDVRIEALSTLGAIGGIRAEKAAETALNDRNRSVRDAAEKILSKG